jgi:FlaA1/EpsC-like NDP-sugar epimerase
MGSNGSVIPFFMNKRKEGFLPITDPKMTRFNISLTDGVEMVLHALETAWGGEIFIPKIPSYKILDVANAVAPDIEKRIIGIRPGEKVHEEMITVSDSFTTYDLGKYYVILPQKPNWELNEFIDKLNAKLVPIGFNYNSGENSEWIGVDEIRELIKIHVDNNFLI